MRSNNRIVSLNKLSIFLLAVLIFIIPSYATPFISASNDQISVAGGPTTLNVADGNISVVGGTTTLNVALSGISNGISGYNITIYLSHPEVAEIVSVEFPAWTNLTNSSSLPSDSIWIKALDLNKITIGSTNVLLATLTVRGDSQGSTEVRPIVNQIDGDNGTVINPNIVPGLLNIGATAPSNISYNISLSRGWNMISLPVNVTNTSVVAIFGGNVTTVYGWTGTSYSLRSVLEPKKGYWALSNSNYNITVTGTPVVDRNITLTRGWNMVGPVTNGITVSSLPNVTTVYGWSGTSYTMVSGSNILTLTKGYWVLANATSTIQI